MVDYGIKYLAVHWDLDVLNPYTFRSIYPTGPRISPEEFFAAVSRLELKDVEDLLVKVDKHATIVSLTFSEHLPWEAFNMRQILSNLNIFN